MTEQEWLTCDDLTELFERVVDTWQEGGPGMRKFLLAACACCRRGWDLLEDERSRGAIDATEAYADGELDEAELREASAAAQAVVKEARRDDPDADAGKHGPAHAYTVAAAYVGWYDDEYTYGYGVCYGRDSWGATTDDELAIEAALVREVLGNPFRPVVVEAGWLTPDVRRVARALYEERAFDRLSILADALEEAGCTNQDVLDHLRGPGPHVRGCWALDLILARK